MKKLPKLDNVNIELLSYISDDELTNLHRRLVKERDIVLKIDDRETKKWEEEICYVQRELQKRMISRNMHRAYMEEFHRSYEWMGADYEKEILN